VSTVKSVGIANSAGSRPFDFPAGVAAACRSPIQFLRAAITHLEHRIRAKIAYHHCSTYLALVHRATGGAGAVLTGPMILQKLRRFDPDGLGIWYLAHGGSGVRLDDLCRKAIGIPGLGPPRPIARALDRIWTGGVACLFGQSAGFDLLMAAALIGAGSAATQVAAQLLGPDASRFFADATNQLTRTASAVQSAGRAYARAGRHEPAAQETARWLFQAVNLLRRALNKTDLTSLDEQIARESARESLTAANSAYAAALKLTELLPADEMGRETVASREKIASAARTMDALAARVATFLRPESLPYGSAGVLAEQSARVLFDTVRSLRPWQIDLPWTTVSNATRCGHQVFSRGNDLAEEAAAVLDSWAVLHDLCSPASASSDPSKPKAAPLWAERLVRTISRRWSCHEILSSLRAVSGSSELAVAAAVELSVLRTGSLQLSRELWKLIRTPRCSSQERSLAYQLFLQTERH
jgi:hypothetical protein